MADDKLKIVISPEIDKQGAKKVFVSVERAAEKSSKRVESSFNKSILSLGRPLAGLKTQILGIGAALAGAFATRGIINAGVNIEKLRTKFEVLLKSTEAANKQLDELRKFAARTPFELNGLADASAGLIAFGFSAEQTIPLLEQIGNAAAGSGKDLQEIALIYGQVAAAGKLTGERLLQLQERGINVAPVLAKNLGVAESSIKKLVSQSKISLRDFQQAFQDLTTESGLFAGAIEKQSKTLGGLLSTLSDNFKELQVAIFETFGEEIKFGVDRFINILKGLTFVIVNNRDTIKKFIVEGIDRLKQGFTDIIDKVKEFSEELKKLAILGTTILLVGKLVEVLSSLKVLFEGINILGLASKFKLLANPITAVLAGFAGIGLAIKKLNDIQEEADRKRPIEEQIRRQQEIVDLLKEKLKVRIEEQKTISGFLPTISGQDAISNLQEELAVAIGNLADLKIQRKKALAGDDKDKQEIIDSNKSLTDELKEIFNTVFNFKDPETGEQKKLASIFKVSDEDKEDIKAGWADIFGFLRIGFDNTAETLKKTGNQIASQFKAGVVRGIAGGVQNIVNSLVNGENAFKNFGIFVLQIIGDLAIQLGTTLIAAGIGIESLKALGGAAAVAAGIALVAVGTLIKSFVGGGVDTSALGGGGGGGFTAPTQDTDITGVADEEERQAPTTIVTNINGPVFDKRETGLAIVDILQETFDEEGVVVRQGALA